MTLKLLELEPPYVAVIFGLVFMFIFGLVISATYFCIGDELLMGKSSGFSNGFIIQKKMFKRSSGKVAMSQKLLVFEAMNEK